MPKKVLIDLDVTGSVDSTKSFGLTGASAPTTSNGNGALYAYNDNGAMLYYKDGYGTSHALHSASDYRLKENVATYSASDAAKCVQQVDVKTFNYVEGSYPEDDRRNRIGFIAHELQDAFNFNGIVSGEKDEVMGEEDDSPKMQSVSYQGLVPILWAALQDALIRIKELEGK
jgi:hypothetical protein